MIICQLYSFVMGERHVLNMFVLQAVEILAKQICSTSPALVSHIFFSGVKPKNDLGKKIMKHTY